MSALPTGPTPTLYLYEDTCSGGYFLTAERSDTTLHRFVQEVAMPRDALNAAHQAGVEAERARAAAETTEEWGGQYIGETGHLRVNVTGTGPEAKANAERWIKSMHGIGARLVGRRPAGPWEVQS